MWDISLAHWWEFVPRAIIVYLFLLVVLRLTGKRQIGQLAPFDLVLLLVLSNSVQNAMNGGDNSVIGGIISAATLISMNWAIGWLTYKSKTAERLIEGRPVILVHDGHVNQSALERNMMTSHELNSALRSQGCTGVEEIRFAILENNGSVTVIRKDDAEVEPATQSRIERSLPPSNPS